MADIGDMIHTLLVEREGGMPAKEIAICIGKSRSEVNSYLYSHLERFEKDSSYVPNWHISNAAMESDPVMLKLQNRANAKEFSLSEFETVADWDDSSGFIGAIQYVTRNGRVIDCDSQSEYLLLSYLEENELVKDIGGQALQVTYESAFVTGKRYQPDIVVLTHDNHIAIFEVKAASAMSNHMNMEKYDALAEFCKGHGYMYVMLDPKENFVTFEDVRDMDVQEDLLEMFEVWMDEPEPVLKSFDESDVDLWYKTYGQGVTRKTFNLQVHSLIIFYRWYNLFKHGFRVYNRPVKLDSDHNVVEFM